MSTVYLIRHGEIITRSEEHRFIGRQMKLNRVVLLVVFLSFGGMLSSCADKNSQPIVQDYAVANEYTFAVSYDNAWKGTVQAISEEERIHSLERESGLIVTEYKTINNLVQSLIHTSMFGRVYKNGYTVHLSEVASGQTRIKVRSNLTLEQLALTHGELHDDSIESYMRQELFRKICINLYQDARKCTTLFPDYHQVSVACSVPPPTSEAPLAGQPTPPPRVAAKALVVQVKQVQQALIKAGYEPGPVDGLMGQKTRAAILRFQKDKGVEGSGYINQATMVALGLQNAAYPSND